MPDPFVTRSAMPLYDRVEEPPQVTHVRVINRNTFEIEDRYDGEVFLFKPSVRVTVPYVVAQHIFGLDMNPKEQLYHCMRRFGWNTPNTMENAQMYFNNISIAPVFMKLVEATPDPDFPEPQRRQVAKPPGRSRYKPPGEDDDDPEDKPAA